MYYFFVTSGYETVRALALHGCHVVMACRDVATGQKAAKKIREEQVCIHVFCDFYSMMIFCNEHDR